MSNGRCPGPQGRLTLFLELDDGTLCRQTSPLPGPLGGVSIWPELHEPGYLPAAFGLDEAITESDKAEFAIIKSMPVLNHEKRAYKSVNSYVADRTRYFGSPNTYALFAAESDAELANTKWVGRKRTRTLRSMLEFGKNSQLPKQQIFYRWVRKAYQRKYGVDVSVPELIRKGMSQELADKIAEVRGSVRLKTARAEQFHAGGFNPRPIKYDHHYLLGTLSEHGTGMAVDIDDSRNPQLTLDEWKFIQTLAGKKVDRSGRWTSEAEAEALWADFKDVNDLFVANVASEIKRIEKSRAEKEKAEKEKAEKEQKNGPTPPTAPASPVKPPIVVTLLQEVLGKHHGSLAQWASTGFFNLPLELVLELHAHGFVWGAAFGSNVDLHHFELPD